MRLKIAHIINYTFCFLSTTCRLQVAKHNIQTRFLKTHMQFVNVSV